MANNCTNRVHFHASKEALDSFEKLVENFSDEDFINHFGSEGDNNIERIGCKWLICEDSYREDDEEFMLGFESANYPPDIMVQNMVAELQKMDSFAFADGRYWDENFDPIGIFQCNEPGHWISDETSVDVDWENEYYWDEEVEPAFEELEL